jgi:NAD(P)H-flavin reductase
MVLLSSHSHSPSLTNSFSLQQAKIEALFSQCGAQWGQFHVFLTQQQPPPPPPPPVGETGPADTKTVYHNGRMQMDNVRETLRDLASASSSSDVRVFVCGPPPMIDSMTPELAGLVGADRVHFEKWW